MIWARSNRRFQDKFSAAKKKPTSPTVAKVLYMLLENFGLIGKLLASFVSPDIHSGLPNGIDRRGGAPRKTPTVPNSLEQAEPCQPAVADVTLPLAPP